MGPGVGFDVAARAEGLEGAQSRSRLERARLEARLNHAEVPRRSRAHAPPPAPASVRMSPVLLRTGPASSWVGTQRAAGGQEKLEAPAANHGRGRMASGGGGQSLAARIRDSAAQPSAVPCGRTFFCKQRACGGRAMGSTRRSTCCTAVLVHSKKRLHTATHRPLAHCRHVPSPLLAPPTSIFYEHCVVRFPIDNIQDKCQAGSIRTSNFV